MEAVEEDVELLDKGGGDKEFSGGDRVGVGVGVGVGVVGDVSGVEMVEVEEVR